VRRPAALAPLSLLPLLAAPLLLAGAAFAAPDEPAPTPAPAALPEAWQDAYARVDGVAILRTAIDADAKQGMPKAVALQRRITLELLRAGLARAGRSADEVPAADLEQAFADAKAQLARRKVELEDALAKAGQSVEEFKQGLKIPLAFRNYVRDQLSEEKLRQLFSEQKLAMAGELRLSHIFLKVTKERPAKAAQAKAEALLKQLGSKATAQAFAGLASEASEDPMASLTGGDLDWLRRNGKRGVPREVTAAAFRFGKVGLVPEPVRSARGLHLLFVVQVRLPPSATYERMAPQIRAQAERSEAARLLDTWREKSRIEYAPDAPRQPQRR